MGIVGRVCRVRPIAPWLLRSSADKLDLRYEQGYGSANYAIISMREARSDREIAPIANPFTSYQTVVSEVPKPFQLDKKDDGIPTSRIIDDVPITLVSFQS